MSKSDTFEHVLAEDYPDGDLTDACDIDDFTRAIKAANAERLDQEHYWRPYGDDDHDWQAEGAHRPYSARVWPVTLSNNDSELYKLSAAGWVKDYHDNALFVVYGNAIDDAETSGWNGTAWWLDGTTLRPLISRIRGNFFIDGVLNLGPQKSRWQGVSVGDFVIDEGREGMTPTLPTDDSLTGIRLYPSLYSSRKEHYDSDGDNKPIQYYVVRVGQYNPITDDYNPPTGGYVYGVAFDIGNYMQGFNSPPNNYPTGAKWGGVRVALTQRGIEFYTSGDYADEDVLVNGIALKNHDHSGGINGAPVAITAFDTDPDGTNRITWCKYTEKTFTLPSTISRTSWSRIYQSTNAWQATDFWPDLTNYSGDDPSSYVREIVFTICLSVDGFGDDDSAVIGFAVSPSTTIPVLQTKPDTYMTSAFTVFGGDNKVQIVWRVHPVGENHFGTGPVSPPMTTAPSMFIRAVSTDTITLSGPLYVAVYATCWRR